MSYNCPIPINSNSRFMNRIAHISKNKMLCKNLFKHNFKNIGYSLYQWNRRNNDVLENIKSNPVAILINSTIQFF